MIIFYGMGFSTNIVREKEKILASSGKKFVTLRQKYGGNMQKINVKRQLDLRLIEKRLHIVEKNNMQPFEYLVE